MNNAILANTISVANSVTNTDFFMVVRDATANNWSLKLVAGLTANVVAGSNTLHILNGLVVAVS
jgi:hypothetical protein